MLKNKTIIIASIIASIILIILVVFRGYISSVTKNSNNMIINAIFKSNNPVVNKNVSIDVAYKYNLEDKYIEKTIDGHIVCRTDLNCLSKYYIECKNSDAVFFDKEVDAGFAFVVRGVVDNKCNVDIFSEKDDVDIKSTCNIPLDKLSKDSFNNLLTKTTRNSYEYCK